MVGKNAKTHFQAQVLCMTSAMVRKGLRVFHYGSSEGSSLEVLTYFAAAKNKDQREKLVYAASEWRVFSPPGPTPPPTQYRWLEDPAQHLAGRGEMHLSCIPCYGRLQAMPQERQTWRVPYRGQVGTAAATASGNPSLGSTSATPLCWRLQSFLPPHSWAWQWGPQPGLTLWRWKGRQVLQTLGKDWVSTHEQLPWNST